MVLTAARGDAVYEAVIDLVSKRLQKGIVDHCLTGNEIAIIEGR